MGQQTETPKESSEELENVVIRLDREQYFQVGFQLPPIKKAELVKFLKANTDFLHKMLTTFQELIPSWCVTG